jgi:hypothetical protein
MFTFWWKDVAGKVIPAYMKEVAEDEHYSKTDPNGNYINVVIRKAELQGKLGDTELEASETLPMTQAQIRDMLKEIMGMQIPGVMEAITSPENLPFIKQAFGMNDFVMPGEADRQKQYEEIQLLLQSEPIQQPPDPMLEQAAMNGDPQAIQAMQVPIELPSVEIDPDVDNNEVEAGICRDWLISEVGRQQKIDNPSGYKNVLLHFKAHTEVIQQQMMMQQEQQMMMAASAEGSKSSKTSDNKMPTKQVSAQAGEGDGSRQSIQ